MELAKWTCPLIRKLGLMRNGRIGLMNVFGEIDNVILKPYDHEYPEKYEQEAAQLKEMLTDYNAEFHHIGSTAVPDIMSKPIIDIAVELFPFPLSEESVRKLENKGYIHWNSNPDDNHQFFLKNLPRTHHLHIYPKDSQKLKKEIAFRDLLNDSPKLKHQYEILKKKLAVEHFDDREKYTELKTDFIRSALKNNLTPTKPKAN